MKPLFFHPISKIIGLLIALTLLLLSFAASILYGQTPIPFEAAMASFTEYSEASNEHVIIQMERLPRAVLATIIGASLSISGALMQALTRNPLADPSIFGLNAGALFFVVMGVSLFSIDSLIQIIWFAFIGAAVASILVYSIGSLGRDGLSPVKIVLAGSAISALFLSFSQGLLVINEYKLQDVLFWLAGSVSGRSLSMLLPILPYIIIAWLIALFIGRSINLLITGEEVAKGLGQKTWLVKILIAVTVVFLAGGSVAIAGAIGFVGLIVPHICRRFVGNDYRWLIPYSALVGAILVLFSDIIGRFIIAPQELPIGVTTALIGTPFFIYIARKGFNKG